MRDQDAGERAVQFAPRPDQDRERVGAGSRPEQLCGGGNAGGHSLELLDPHGQVARTLGAGAGLVAATAQGSSSPTWLVTGADAAGVSAAAAALTPKRLADHFALAVEGNSDLPVPLQGAQ